MLDVDRTRLVALSFTLAVLAAPLVAEPAGYNELAAAQAAANAQPDQDARPVPQQHSAHAPETAPRRGGGGPQRL